MHASALTEQSENRLSKCREHIERHIAAVPRHKELMAGPDPLTYGDLFDRIPKIGLLLQNLSIVAGDRVIILSNRDSAVATLFFGLIAHGVTAVLLNPESPADELRVLVKASEASAVFADDTIIQTRELSTLVASAVPLIPVSQVSRPAGLRKFFGGKPDSVNAKSFPGILDRFDAAEGRLPDIDEEVIAYILFTSGTTSRPKGVQISHRSLFAQMQTFVKQYGLTTDSRILNILPLHHTDGLTHGVVVAMVAGAAVYRPMRFSVDRLPELLDLQYKHRITHFITVPSVLTLIRQLGPDYSDSFRYPEFRFIISTAAYLDAKLWDDFQRVFEIRVVNVYGLTETVCEACYCGPDEASFRLGTVGKPVDCEATVFDADGNELKAGAEGELALRGDNIMSGYFRMPEETAAVLKDGWFLTGDLARIDDDGFVQIVGRKKTVIVTGGHNVYPEDVTNVLRSIDGVLDAVTFGIEDSIWGEKVVACVVPAKGSTLTVEYLAAELLKRASKEKLPRDIHIVDDLPRGPAGKVIIAEARQLALSMQGSKTGGDLSDVEMTILKIAAEVFKTPVSDLGPESSPANTEGWNSLAHVELLLAIERAYSLRLDARDIMNITSLQHAVNIVRQRLPA